MIVLMTTYPIVYMIQPLWLKGTVIITLVCVMLFIWSRPSVVPEFIEKPVTNNAEE